MKFRSDSIDRLFETILDMNSIEECYAFFGDLCTVKELQDMAQRLQTAVLLSQGVSYQEITQKVGISTATIGRVSRCLNYGNEGYRLAIEKRKAQEDNL